MRWSRHCNPSPLEHSCCWTCPNTVSTGATTTTATTGSGAWRFGRRRPAPTWPLMPALMATLLALTPLSAAAGAPSRQEGPSKLCGTLFTDPESSALLADLVLEGRVREKHPPGQDEGPYPGRYNVSIQVRKHVWKGEALIRSGTKRASKLLLGSFAAPPRGTDPPSNLGDDGLSVEAVQDGNSSGRRQKGGSGGERRGGSGGIKDAQQGGETGRQSDKTAEAEGGEAVDCVGEDLADGATYVFFLKEAAGSKGKYFVLSASPVKWNKRVGRLITKIYKEATKPKIQQLKAPKKVTKGSSISLRCKTKGKPDPIFTWYLNGQEINSDKTMKIKSTKRSSRIKVNNVESRHSGVYTCKVTNALGEDSEDVKVIVPETNTMHTACEKQTFCLNGGTCRFLPSIHVAYCQCPEEWAGHRCELLDINSLRLRNKVSHEATLLYDRTLIIIGLVIALLVFVVICIASYFLAKRRQKKSMAERRMKADDAAKRVAGDRDNGETRLLLSDQTDGHSSPAHGFRPKSDKCTQTVNEVTCIDFPPAACTSPSRTFDDDGISNPNKVDNPQPITSDNFFRQLPTFSGSAPERRSNSHQRPPRTVSDNVVPDDLERRGSRSRLKAVSADDSSQGRRESLSRHDVPDTSMPAIAVHGRDYPVEVLEPELVATRLPVKSDNNPGVGIKLEDGGRENGTPSPRRALPDFRLLDEPVVMEIQPTYNAYAQLKTPPVQNVDDDEQKCSPELRTSVEGPKPASSTVGSIMTSEEDWPFSHDLLYGAKIAQPLPAAVNEVLNGCIAEDDEEPQEHLLAPLHISEEDLNGNLPKRNSFQSRFLTQIPPTQPPAQNLSTTDKPAYSTYAMSPILEQRLPTHSRPANLARSREETGRRNTIPSGSQDVSGGVKPRACNSTGPDSETPTAPDKYAYDPSVMDSPDPNNLDEQFMHKSPIKGGNATKMKTSNSYPTGAENQHDFELKMKKIKTDQEAIPI